MEKLEFLRLKKEWYKKLKDNGFSDIENDHQRLKAPNLRTTSWRSFEITRQYYSLLEHYVTDHPNIPEKEREILCHYINGVYATEISLRVRRCKTTVIDTISKYREIIKRMVRDME